VPLALFGQKHYARLMGRIALPSLLAQAAAPLIGTVLIQNFGHQTTLIVLGIFATLSEPVVGKGLYTCRPQARALPVTTYWSGFRCVWCSEFSPSSGAPLGEVGAFSAECCSGAVSWVHNCTI